MFQLSELLCSNQISFSKAGKEGLKFLQLQMSVIYLLMLDINNEINQNVLFISEWVGSPS